MKKNYPMKGSNRALFTCILIWGLASFANAQGQVIDKVIGTVGGEYILLSDVLEQKAKLEAQQGTLPENIDCILVEESQMLAERMRGQIALDIKVTPSEVNEFFQKIPNDSLPYFNSEVEIGEIVVSPKVNLEERSKAQEKAKGLLEQIQDGADFADLAKKNSMDGSARIGGDLGWTKRGSFVPEFEASAYNLEAMEISDLVESEFGFHIIQLLERRGNSIHTRHILIKRRDYR
ncbi:unnamed protein product [Bathycoccus prasinos]